MKDRTLLGQFSRKYTVDEQAFRIVDSCESAYWMGFIAADGCLSINTHTGSKTVSIALSSKDCGHLEKLKRFLNHTKPLSTISRGGYQSCRIEVYSSKIFASLENLGIHPRKSLDFIWPKVPENLSSHFIRGYFDGDGHIGNHRSPYHTRFGEYRVAEGLVFEIMGTESFLTSLRDRLPDFIVIRSKISPAKKASAIYRLRFYLSDPDKVSSLHGFMYTDCAVFLERKEIIIREYIESCGSRRYPRAKE